MSENRKKRTEEVYLKKDYLQVWMSTIIVALVQFGVLPEEAVEAEDFDMRMHPFDDDGVVELTFVPSGYRILLREVVVFDEGDGSLMLIALIPSHDDRPLCSAFVPRRGYQSLGEIVISS